MNPAPAGGSGPGDRPRVLVVVGTRPEAVKMAPVLEALRRREEEVEALLVLSGQHDDLVRPVLDAFGLTVHRDLKIMTADQTLPELGSRCLVAMDGLLEELRPHEVLVQGDTATVFFAALAAFFRGIPVGHVEAGLRSGDKWAPFPEEVLRRLTDGVVDHWFAPTPEAVRNLAREGVAGPTVHLTGNPVVDALEAMARTAPPRPELFPAGGARRILLTAHRRESHGEPLERVFRTVRELADEGEDLSVLYPVHPNPNVREPAHRILGGHPRIRLADPLDYPDLLSAIQAADLILTDSGGIQEEAPTFGVPVLVLREVTERPEGVAAGVARLVGTDAEAIRKGVRELLAGDRTPRPNPYGDGRAGERIADIVISTLNDTPRQTRDWDPAP